eukprot:TRINITY_DN711_c1_g1_i1.p1 TRINITY_DN711_c1_g1~~TRINITY_DN711_c1_g1_i1.p1  ORF type:complete len:159 (-),score=69.93 TRINITY_DN711_c1_g1_i1:757-1233(-)
MADNLEIEEFEQAGSGASTTFPMQCSAIKKNGFAVLKGRPCKVVETSTSKTGKHGHAKVHMVGIDIFNGKKYEEICPSTHNMDVPVIKRSEYSLMDITDDNYVSLLLHDGSERNDLQLPTSEIGVNLRKAFDDGKDIVVAIIGAMDEEQIISFKESNK